MLCYVSRDVLVIGANLQMNWTPLMIASSAGRSDVVSLLLEYGASANAQNSTGQSALHYAASKQRLEAKYPL